MEIQILEFWLLLLATGTIFSVWKRNAVLLMITSLFLLAFGYVLTFDGIDIVNGINISTGAFTFEKHLPTNDQLLQFFAIGTIPVAFALFFFSLNILIVEMLARYQDRTI